MTLLEISFRLIYYADYKLVAMKLKNILNKHIIKYLHGYPASIYDFALFCKNEDPELQNLLTKNLKGVFLGSEFPHKHYREIIEEVFNVETISWYGHTERSVLAYEKEVKFNYEPFFILMDTEAIYKDKGNYQLIATSYYNKASPLIRYNTEDQISNVEFKSYKIMKSFRIINGRYGEFVIDKSNKKINLTGLIFGQHHEIFNHSKFIQVRQPKPGEIEIHYVAKDLKEEMAIKLINLKNLNFDVIVVRRKEPFRTISGKINLIIK